MQRGLTLTKSNGLMAMINLQSWMFLSSYEDFRIWLLDNAVYYYALERQLLTLER